MIRALCIEQKNPRLKTVVNKLGSIHATFRTFDMEVIAGEPNFETEVVRPRSLGKHASMLPA